MTDWKPGDRAYVRDPDEYYRDPETTVYGGTRDGGGGDPTIFEVVAFSATTTQVRVIGGLLNGHEQIVATGRLVPIK